MRAISLYSLLAAMLFGQDSGGGFTLKSRNALIEERVVGRQELTLAAAVRASREILSQETARKLKVLAIYNDPQAAAEEVVFCESYKQWSLLRNAFPKARFGAAQLVAIGNDAMLLVRLEDGGVSRQILSGTDPTKFEEEGIPLEILSVSARKRSQFEGCGMQGTIEPHLYLKTTAALTAELCERTTARLAQTLGSEHIWAGFRNDEWFLCSQFPLFYPFSPQGPIPTEMAHRNSPEFTCSITCDGVPKCVLTSGSSGGRAN
jgi:hypothetical protein